MQAQLEARIMGHFSASASLKTAAAPVLSAPIARAIAMMTACLRAGGKILAC